MATGSGFILVSFLLMLLVHPLICYSEKGSNKGVREAKETQLLSVNVIKVSSLLAPTICSTSTPIKGVNTVGVVHQYGPCSASWLQKDQAQEITLEHILNQDQIRVDSLHYTVSNKYRKADFRSQKTKIPANSGVSYGTGNYVVQVGFGTPTKPLGLIFDTGSDLTWIQCQPCTRSCYSQKDQIFDPSKSTSYSSVTCNSTECSLLKSATGISPGCGSSSGCIYGIQYGDQSFSIGNFGHEKLTIGPDVFANFQFGCGQNNQGLFGGAAGLIGLGRDKISFVSQTSSKYGGVFSYCLPTKSGSNGYLSLGTEGIDASVKFTPMTTDSRSPSFYFLNTIAITVGGRNLPISGSVFAASGMIIDSGTVITRLPPSAYSSLKSAFVQLMSSYPRAPALSILDTCYNFTGYTNINVPKIAFMFQGNVKLDIDPLGTLIGSGVSQLCLAFAGNGDANDIGIIGNLQQQKTKVVYDNSKKMLGFGPGSCS